MEELGTKEALLVIEKLSDYGCRELYLTGGEPLVRKDIWQILKKAKENKIRVGLLTNGLLVSEKSIKKIKGFVTEIGISIDGSSPETNDKIRGKGTFRKILKATVLIKKFEIPLTVHLTVNAINFQDIEAIVKTVKELGVENIRINEITLRGRAVINKSLLAIDKNINVENYVYKKVNKALNLNSDKVDRYTSDGCEIDPDIIFLSPDGHIYPCVEVFQAQPSLSFGLILDSNQDTFTAYKKMAKKSKGNNCPYKFVVGTNYAICLNQNLVKCPFLQKKKNT